jgi:hypothetical protein
MSTPTGLFADLKRYMELPADQWAAVRKRQSNIIALVLFSSETATYPRQRRAHGH